MTLMAIMTGFVTILSMYPFSLEQTIAILAGGKLVIDHLLKKQWAKAGELAYNQSLDLFEEVMSDDQKRKVVIAAVWSRMPAMLRAFATEKQVGDLVDAIYQTKTKITAKEKDLIKGDLELKVMKNGRAG